MLSKILILLPALATFIVAAPTPNAMPAGLSDIEKSDWCAHNAQGMTLEDCRKQLDSTIGIDGSSVIG